MKTIKSVLVMVLLSMTFFSCNPPVNPAIANPLSNTVWYGEFEGYGYDLAFISGSSLTIKSTYLSTMSSSTSIGTYVYSDATLTGKIEIEESEYAFSVSNDYKKISVYGVEGILEFYKK